jgi:hypothetical protein
MIAVLTIIVFAVFAGYRGMSDPTSLDVHYGFLQLALRTGAVSITAIALAVWLAAIVFRNQKHSPRAISLKLADGTTVKLDGVEHMRDNLAQILAALGDKAASGSVIVSSNDNNHAKDDRMAGSDGH